MPPPSATASRSASTRARSYHHALTGSGWPTYYLEDYAAQSLGFHTQLGSLICEGVFVKYPRLKVVLIESGVTWLPPYLWRLSKFWRGVRNEVPWIDRSPEEFVRDHIRLTIQPFDAPPSAAHIGRIMDQLQSDDMLLFSTDFPHWQFDGDEMLPAGLSPELAPQDPDRQSARHLSPSREAPHDARRPADTRRSTPMPIATTGAPAQARLKIIDGDVHPAVRSMADLKPFLSPRWREHLEVYGSRRRLGMGYEPYPKSAPRACRRDAWPEGGGNPGSDLDLIRTQYLDAYGIEYGILGPLGVSGQSELNQEFSAALASATNDWQREYFTRPEPRLKVRHRRAERARGGLASPRSSAAPTIRPSPRYSC